MKDDRKLKNKKKLEVTKKGCFGAFAALSLGYFFKTASDFFYTKDLACSLILKTAEGVKKEDILDAISYANQIGRLDLISVLLGFLGIILGFGAVFGFLGIKESSENIAKNTAETWIKKNAKGIIDETIDEAVRGNKIVEKAEKEVKNSKNTDVQNKEEYKNL
jgi:hypothetical protein